MPVLVQLVEDVGRHHPHRPLGEVDDLGATVDEDEADGRDGVEGPGPESDDRELEDLAHRSAG